VAAFSCMEFGDQEIRSGKKNPRQFHRCTHRQTSTRVYSAQNNHWARTTTFSHDAAYWATSCLNIRGADLVEGAMHVGYTRCTRLVLFFVQEMGQS